MAQNEPTRKHWSEVMMNVPRQVLYGLLIVIISITLFVPVQVPVVPQKSTKDLFSILMTIPEGSTILIQSDWTNSTRGESAWEFQALMRILMRRNIKFAVMTSADPQAPEVARKAIDDVNRERVADSERPYVRGVDWVNLGFFPNAEGTGQGLASNVAELFSGRYDQGESGRVAVMETPVLKDIRRIEDFPAMIVVTASKTIDILVERIARRTKLCAMVTGVMGPETLVYHQTGQISGLAIGLTGVAEIEQLMERGMDPNGGDGAVLASGYPKIEGFKGMKNIGNGSRYYFPLHNALGLMILAIVLGNVGMYVSRKRRVQS